MGAIEIASTIAGSVTAIIGLFFYLQRKSKQKSIDERGRNEAELAILINNAINDEERKKYAKILHDLRNPK